MSGYVIVFDPYVEGSGASLGISKSLCASVGGLENIHSACILYFSAYGWSEIEYQYEGERHNTQCITWQQVGPATLLRSPANFQENLKAQD